MHIHKTKKLIKTALYAAIISCAAGAATGTLAWYSYVKDVNVDFKGTTIKADKEIQIGLRSAAKLNDFEDLYQLGEIEIESGVKFNEDDENSFYIYWVKGNYASDILRNFQKEIHSADGLLNPITAGKYGAGWAEDIGNTNPAAETWNGFKYTPTQRKTQYSKLISANDYSDYFYLPLAFRSITNNPAENGDKPYLHGSKIFLSEFNSVDLDKDADHTEDLSKGLRCKVDYPSHADTSDNFIFNPNSSSDKNLEVGGVLNLSNSNTYDFDSTTMKEIAYGEWVTTSYKSSKNTTAPTRTPEQCTTFDADHYEGVYELDLENSEACTCETKAKTAAIETSFNQETGNGIAVTNCYNDYAFVDLSIYLEGWDENIVNVTAGRTFSVELQFSLD